MPPRAQKRKVSTPKTAGSDPRRVAAAQAVTPGAPGPRAPGTPPQTDAKSAAFILLAFPMLATIGACSLATWAYKRALDPLYGSIPTDIHLTKAIWAGTGIGGFLIPVSWLSGWTSALLFGLSVATLPTVAHYAAVFTSERLHDALLGPIATHAIALVPSVTFGVSTIRSMVHFFEAANEGTMMRYTLLPGCASIIPGFAPVWTDTIPMLLNIPEVGQYISSESALVIAVGALIVSVWAIGLAFRSGNARDPGAAYKLTWHILVPATILPLLPIILPQLLPPTLPHPLLEPYHAPGSPVRILSSVQSLTGLVVVGESLPTANAKAGASEEYPSELRYLRTAHSILGGTWVGSKVARAPGTADVDALGSPIGDSIYNAFIVQEAIRLVDTTDRDITPGEENALIIGLGVGIAATALTKHGVTPTIIEIDPAVYNASLTWFGLLEPAPERLFLEDGRRIVRRKVHEHMNLHTTEPLYDYVIHDCFSGGGVPAHLYTSEFWGELKGIMKPDGVVAVNYAGLVGGDASRSVLMTLEESFGQCRIFHDSITPVSDEELTSEFRNLIIFCSPSTKPLTFRSAVEADFLGSPLRSRVLGSFGSKWEVNAHVVRGDLEGKDSSRWILRDQPNHLADWQKPAAFEHWKIMRNILPEVFWTTY
ncbi:hypothetical protein PENSPDRAFT_689537 [Peniophora sp. CONT]|nr:hypothetical protein PENSPDRAFT_689537 [Peniophora sp. CONT]